jgi:hypothetical protein
MLNALERLAREFDRIAVPEHGRYVRTDARDGGRPELPDSR